MVNYKGIDQKASRNSSVVITKVLIDIRAICGDKHRLFVGSFPVFILSTELQSNIVVTSPFYACLNTGLNDRSGQEIRCKKRLQING
jgi:hypothetical protein